MAYLISETTKAERIALIKQWQEPEDGMAESDMDLFDLYADYINGIKEISECNAAFSERDGAGFYTEEDLK